MIAGRRSHGILVLGALVAACEWPADAGLHHLRLERIVPPSAYRVWWAETESCSGVQGDFERVRFYLVRAPVGGTGRWFPCESEEGALCSGLWRAPHDIYLAPALVESERLVKHEMLHDLVRVAGHPPVFESCGSLE